MSSGRGRSPCDTGPRKLQLDGSAPGMEAAARDGTTVLARARTTTRRRADVIIHLVAGDPESTAAAQRTVTSGPGDRCQQSGAIAPGTPGCRRSARPRAPRLDVRELRRGTAREPERATAAGAVAIRRRGGRSRSCPPTRPSGAERRPQRAAPAACRLAPSVATIRWEATAAASLAPSDGSALVPARSSHSPARLESRQRPSRRARGTCWQAVLEHPMCGNPASSGSGNHSVCQVPEHELGGSR